MEEKEPLVSIIVITYNSSKYVLETLESAKNQTYDNIELIITDDGSVDDTVKLCEEWLDLNQQEFINTKLITVEKNTGIPANCNRGVKVSKGEWIKIIAGDDMLKTNCIYSNLNFCKKNSSIKIVTSISQSFHGELKKSNFKRLLNNDSCFFYESNVSAYQQYRMLLFKCIIHAPNVFIHKIIFDDVGEFDEKFKFMEDYPYWLRVARKGYKFYYINEITVFYRIHNCSIYNKQKKEKLFNDFYRKKRRFEQEYIFPNIKKYERNLYKIDYALNKYFDELGLNKNILIFKIVYLTLKKISPLMIYRYFKFKLIHKNGS